MKKKNPCEFLYILHSLPILRFTNPKFTIFEHTHTNDRTKKLLNVKKIKRIIVDVEATVKKSPIYNICTIIVRFSQKTSFYI